jgi:alkylhydroperoxidase family enzyme
MQTTTDPLPRAGVLRAGLVSLGIPQLALGIWALVSPSGFYGTFPVVAGQHWLPAYGPYDSHLVTDVGSTFLAIGLLMLFAAWFLERRVVGIALVVYLAYAIPHFIFHLRNDDVLSSGSQVVNGAALGLAALSALALLGLLLRPPPTSSGRTPDRPGESGSRVGPPKGGILTRIVRAYSRRQYGGETTPGDVFRHHVPLLLGYGAFETALERSHSVPERLKILGETKAATVVGCEWCMDFASHLARKRAGLSDAELMDLPRYRESERFDELDKLVLDYAVAISRTPADVGDELFARLREKFSDRQLVELTTAISLENFRARFNHALGMEAQGFSEGAFCVIPDAVAA